MDRSAPCPTENTLYLTLAAEYSLVTPAQSFLEILEGVMLLSSLFFLPRIKDVKPTATAAIS